MSKPILIFLIITALILDSVNVYSQNRNSQWVFGDSAGIDFSSGTPVTFESTLRSRGSFVSIADSMGQLLFYSCTYAGGGDSTTQINNKLHQLMINGSSIIGEGWYNELLIIPNPGKMEEYFLFSISMAVPTNQGLLYSKIDLALNNGLGEVIQKNIRINSFRNADCLTAIKHGNGRDWWLISKYSSSNITSLNRFYLYLITQDSIHSPIIQDFNNSYDIDNQRVIFNSNGAKFMQINAAGVMQEFDFDRCTGIISNPNMILPQLTSFPLTRYLWSGAYSPDNSKFYLSTQLYNLSYNDTSWLIQYNLNSTNISNSADTLFWVKHNVQGGELRLAPNDKIYYTCMYFAPIPNGFPYPDSIRFTYNENLSVINYPDSLGTSCNFQPFSFYLGGKRTYAGLPDNPNYELGPLFGSSCDTLTNIIEKPSVNLSSHLNLFYSTHVDIVFINASNIHEKNGRLIIQDIQGRLMYQKQITFTNGYYTIDFNVNSFTSGMYFVSIQTESQTLTNKFIKT